MSEAPHETLDLNRMLLDFVRGRDVTCPLCGYNLRNLTKPTCPECEHTLEMRVGVQSLHLLPFVLAITPGIFGGLCAAFLAVIISVNFIVNAGQFVGVPGQIFILDGLGWLSGLFTVFLIATRVKFLSMPRPKQRALAAVIWFVNFMALAILALVVLLI